VYFLKLVEAEILIDGKLEIYFLKFPNSFDMIHTDFYKELDGFLIYARLPYFVCAPQF
jgi:hypothetical protein